MYIHTYIHTCMHAYVNTRADYIFYEATRLGVSQVVPLPAEHEVAGTALPSQRFPSDHLSLCCDLHWLPSPLKGELLLPEEPPLSQGEGVGGG